MNITEFTKNRNRLFILVVALLGIVIAVSLAFVWPTSAVATDESSPSAEPAQHLYSLNQKTEQLSLSTAVNVQNPGVSKEDLPIFLGKVAMSLRLRDILTKYGISPEDNVTVSLSIDDIEAVSSHLPKGSSRIGSTPIDKSFKAAIIEDFLTPAETTFNLSEAFYMAYGIPKPLEEEGEEMHYTLTFESKDPSGKLIGKSIIFMVHQFCPDYIWCYS